MRADLGSTAEEHPGCWRLAEWWVKSQHSPGISNEGLNKNKVHTQGGQQGGETEARRMQEVVAHVSEPSL